MRTYIYTLKLVERLWDKSSWTDEDEAIVTAHFNHLRKDFENKIVLFAGRTENTDSTGFGIVIFNAKNEKSAEEYMTSDPVIAYGIMTSNCKEFRIALS